MLIKLSDAGLYCEAGDFYIDPWKPVARAVITHAHADHARAGSNEYYAIASSHPILKKRLGQTANIIPVEYGEPLQFGDAKVSLHSAGHILGSAQVRVEVDGEVWVASGDYKRDDDPSCEPFEIVRCDTFITEATFALPVYRWPAAAFVAKQVYDWWQENTAKDRASVLFCYALGKAQRLLAELTAYTDKTVLLHGAVTPLTDIYRQAGVTMLPTEPAVLEEERKKRNYAGELIIAPPGANGTLWMRRFGQCSTGFCSGWMQIRGNRRRRGYDRGFIISDHADWPALIKTIEQTGAQRVLATHGQSDVLVRYLNERGIEAAALATYYGDEALEEQSA